MNQVLQLQPGDRILVTRTDRLGDLILALPLVETLKVRYPECRVDVMASLYASPILENNEFRTINWRPVDTTVRSLSRR